MAKIRSFAGRMNAEGAERLTAALARAFAAGDELGPRGPQIRALGLSLDNLVDALRAQLAGLSVTLAEAGVQSSGHPRTHALLAEVERIADLARTYRGPDTAAAGDTTVGAALRPQDNHPSVPEQDRVPSPRADR